MINANLYERAQKLLREINNKIIVCSAPVTNIKWMPCDYKTDNTLPNADDLADFCGKWGGKNDTHALFRFEVDVPRTENVRYEVFVDSGVNG